MSFETNYLKPLMRTWILGLLPVSPVMAQDLMITGVIDGPLSGGVPKAIELYVLNDIADLSAYGVGSANNGGGSNGEEFTFPAVPAGAGEYIYIASEDTGFNSFFGFAPDYVSSAASINGDDAIELFHSGSVVDVFGDINVDGSSQPWDYMDGWAYRIDGSGPDGATFELGHWSFSGINALDGETQNSSAAQPFPSATYTTETTVAQCGDPATLISTIQGSGTSSPEAGNVHSIEGIVIGDFQGTGLSGFFVQEESADQDANPLTSEGLFVFSSAAVNEGDKVRVTGKVSEYFDLTELSNVTQVTVCSSGHSVAAASISLPVPAAANGVPYLERYENMLVGLAQPLTVTENYNHGRYGELTLSNGRLFQPTHVAMPGAPAAAVAAANALNRIIIDDGDTVQNPYPIINPDGSDFASASDAVRNGSLINTDGLAVLHYSFSEYRLQPVLPFTVSDANPRESAPSLPGTGSLKVAAFNVLNYFTTIDNGSSICGPSATLDCRGADSASEFSRQRAKIIHALAAMDADIIGLIELENNASAAIQNLVDGLNTQLGGTSYGFVDTGTIGTDAIKVGLIYKLSKVNPVGAFAVLDSTVDARFLDTKNRPALIQTFEEMASGERLTVAVNHFKSKGSACDDVGDPDNGDGQGNCNATRADAAAALVEFLATDPTASGDDDFLIIGDLNAYAMEDPITEITTAGYVDLLHDQFGSAAYSYVFGEQFGYLDHALASLSLKDQVTGVSEWHINADEPRVADYNEDDNLKSAGQAASLYSSDPFRSSDHDPLIVELSLGGFSNGVPQCLGKDATIYVDQSGKIVGGLFHGRSYRGVLIGTRANDVIVGTDGKDVIRGGNGRDKICGLGGADKLFGGRDRDQLAGGSGRDWLDGGQGFDALNGGPGIDKCLRGESPVTACERVR